MFTENKNVEATDLGGGVTRKILSYSKNLMTWSFSSRRGLSVQRFPSAWSRLVISCLDA